MTLILLHIVAVTLFSLLCLITYRGKKDKKREKTRDSSRDRRERSTSRKTSTRDKGRQDGKAKPAQVRNAALYSGGFEVDFMNHTPAQVSEGPLSLSDTVQEFNQIDCDGITATVVVPISTVNLVFFTKLILKMI